MTILKKNNLQRKKKDLIEILINQKNPWEHFLFFKKQKDKITKENINLKD
jgi:hypothetical protein